MFIRLLLSFFVFSTISVTVFAEETSYFFSIEKAPFKTCQGTGNSQFSRYSGELVNVIFNKNSLQVSKAGVAKKETYASLKTLCGVDLTGMNVVCESQEENLTSSTYQLTKICSAPIPGIPANRGGFHFKLNLTLNFRTDNNKTNGSGHLTCVANEDGFSGIVLKACN